VLESHKGKIALGGSNGIDDPESIRRLNNGIALLNFNGRLKDHSSFIGYSVL